jgi:hypothetical protein
MSKYPSRTPLYDALPPALQERVDDHVALLDRYYLIVPEHDPDIVLHMKERAAGLILAVLAASQTTFSGGTHEE